jgi:pimeloyl-ACP methyl ester carboxylesterase
MKTLALSIFFLLFVLQNAAAQNYTPVIEPCACMIKIEKGLVSKCGYLVVPENRQKPLGRKIKIPFVFTRRPEADSVKNITLYTTGGPGYSTIANFDSIRYRSDFFKFGGFIAFDQRGTKLAQPCLQCNEIDVAVKRAYKENLPKDSLELDAVKKCRKRLVAQGIDLSAYNTIESAADINDLRLALHLDSLNLLGVSYSGGLMLTVVRNYPAGVKSLLLNSPLPGYARYEEDALLNINDALNRIFDNCERDSVGNVQYHNLRERFHQYFSGITGKVFTIAYTEKDTHHALQVHYTKNELLDAIVNRIDNGHLKEVPFVINEIINGNNESYVTEVLDDNFSGNTYLSHGMRYSVYCTEQIAYADKTLVKKQDLLLPWLSGYPFNNVNHAICSCWNVKPEPAVVKTPVYSTIPALLSSGDADPWCPSFYNRLIKRYMPNSQLLIFHNRAHASGFWADGIDFVQMFMENPYQKIISTSKNVVVE